MAGSIEKRGKDSYRLVCTNGYDLKLKENLLNFLNLQKYGKEIMVQKNLHLQHIKDIAEC